jgi:hypothetical protein
MNALRHNALSFSCLKTLALVATLGGCYGGEAVDDAQQSPANALSPAPLTCPFADRFLYTESHVQSVLDALNTTIPAPAPFTLALDTSNGDCFLAPAQVGSGVRVNGTFALTSSLTLHNNMTASFVADSDGSDPYLVELDIALGTVTFASQGDVDISVPCLGLDRRLDGTMRDVTVKLFYAPPKTGRTSFRFDHIHVDFGSTTVVNPDATIAWFTPVCSAINANLASASTRASIESTLEGTIAAQSVVTSTLPSTLTSLFWLAAPGTSSSSICSAILGGGTGCSTADCAEYKINP